MAEVTNRQVNIYIATGDAEKALDVLKKKERELKDALSQATDPRVVQKLEAELKKLAQPIENATNKLSGKLSPSLKDLTKTVSALDRELKLLSKEDPNFTKKLRQFQQAKVELAQAKIEADKLSGALQKSASGSGLFGKLQSGASSFFGGIGLFAGGTALAAGAALKTSIDEALQAEESAARLQATLDNLGQSDAFDRLSKQAEKLAESFSFLDNDEILGVFDKLLLYGKLSESEIRKLTPVIINFAAKQRISLEESSDAIIKALEGNAKSLKTYGIDIKDASTVTERFGIIINDLGKKVDGAAEAFGDTTTGKIKSAKQEFLNLAEDLGTKLLPAVNFVLNGISTIATAIKTLSSDIATGFKFVFDQTSYYQDQFNDRMKRAENRGATDAQSRYSDLSGLSKEELQKRLSFDQGLLKLSEERIKNEFAVDETEKAANRGLNAEYKERIRLIQEELDLRDKRAKQVVDELKKLREQEDAERQKQIKNLGDQLQEIERQLGLKELSDFQRKLAEINDKFDKLVAKAKQLGSEGLQGKANALREREIEAATEEFQLAMAKKLRSKVALPVIVDVMVSPESQNRFSKTVEALIAGKKPGSATIDTTKPGSEDKTLNDRLKEYVDYAASAVSIYGSISDAISRINERELEDERAKIEKKKALYQQQLDSNLISRKEFDRKTIALDAELAKKEKQIRKQKFRRDQIESGTRAAINIAEAVTKMLTAGPLAGQILAGIAAAAGAVQLGIIASSKFPEYGKGGRLKGPLHSQGGMPVINPRTGQKEAEVEGGEYILSRKTVQNNRRLADALLESSMHRDGAPIFQRGGILPGLNFSRASNSLQRVTRYERGGSFTANAGNTAEMEMAMMNLTAVVGSLQQQLDRGIVAYASIQQFNNQQKRLDNLITDVTMK